jgi:hypothetical protein
MVFHSDLNRFVTALRKRLGPQLLNAPLLYQGTPELRDVLALFDIHIEEPQEALSTEELRARFQSLVENVFAVVAEIRLFALFLDDLHEADDSSGLFSFHSRVIVTWLSQNSGSCRNPGEFEKSDGRSLMSFIFIYS